VNNLYCHLGDLPGEALVKTEGRDLFPFIKEIPAFAGMTAFRYA